VAVEFAHDLLALRAHCPEFLRVGGDGRCTWLPNPAAGDDEATERATRERMDRMGEHVGIGPCPVRTDRGGPLTRPEHSFLRTLHRALVDDERAQLEVALCVAEFRSRGLTRAEVAEPA
jgi:hypothetical protein